mmetsp:Transcript_2430/g.5161  ORF Transcript_2430/g.5161 Transcript_2430/m.5161 type:complete len:332 (-) Transcript_2430:32-1027(-)
MLLHGLSHNLRHVPQKHHAFKTGRVPDPGHLQILPHLEPEILVREEPPLRQLLHETVVPKKLGRPERLPPVDAALAHIQRLEQLLPRLYGLRGPHPDRFRCVPHVGVLRVRVRSVPVAHHVVHGHHDPVRSPRHHPRGRRRFVRRRAPPALLVPVGIDVLVHLLRRQELTLRVVPQDPGQELPAARRPGAREGAARLPREERQVGRVPRLLLLRRLPREPTDRGARQFAAVLALEDDAAVAAGEREEVLLGGEARRGEDAVAGGRIGGVGASEFEFGAEVPAPFSEPVEEVVDAVLRRGEGQEGGEEQRRSHGLMRHATWTEYGSRYKQSR